MEDKRNKGNLRLLLRNLRLKAEGKPNPIDRFEDLSPLLRRAREQSSEVRAIGVGCDRHRNEGKLDKNYQP